MILRLAALACLVAHGARAQDDSTEPYSQPMRDLGYPEPNWVEIAHGAATDPAIEVNSTTQTWGNIAPYDTLGQPLCKWFDDGANDGAGSCKTDISWLHAAAGISKSFFDSTLVNYIIRFHVYGACYLSSVYSSNGAASYCASWWYDPGKAQKVPVKDICYALEWQSDTGRTEKLGCSHRAPVGTARRLREDNTTIVLETAEPARAVGASALPYVASRRLRSGEAPAQAQGGGDAPAETQGRAKFSSAHDLTATTEVYNAWGQEYDRVRQGWYGCRAFTQFGTPQREQCYEQAFGAAFGIDAPTVKLLLQIVQNETRGQEDARGGYWGGVRCTAHFNANVADRPASTSAQDWCERDTADYLVSQRLGPQIGFAGSPARPKSAAAVVFSPPSPPPPRPPPPPMPPAPPLIVPVAYENPFTPADRAAEAYGAASTMWRHALVALVAAMSCLAVL